MVYTLSELLPRVRTWQQSGQEVVFTNGCFDLLHLGHITYLKQAAELGDRLVIGLNSDASVRRLKGAHRPVKDEATRAAILSTLRMVDAVVIFSEDTPLALITALLPDTLVRGGDWAPEQIVGSDVVLAHGGRVESLTFVEGHSTTSLEHKIRQRRVE